MLLDTFERKHDYLRISLIDNCNFRCTYCMPNEEISFLPHAQLMQVDEIVEIAKSFVSLGVTKIRLTGGEPLVRKEFAQICEKLSSLPVELTLTTNGVLVHKHIETFRTAGIRSINVSIDTLQKEKFLQISKRDAFDQVWKNILSLVEHQFSVKLNVVVMKGINDDEVIDFVRLSEQLPIHIRFIEFMPFDKNAWHKDKVIRSNDLIEQLEQHFSFIKLKDEKHATAKKYKLLQGLGSFAFITTMSQIFCSECNRMRLTADGKMKNCLFGKDELDLLQAYRKGEDITDIIKQSVLAKHEKMGGQFKEISTETDASTIINRSMIKIGG